MNLLIKRILGAILLFMAISTLTAACVLRSHDNFLDAFINSMLAWSVVILFIGALIIGLKLLTSTK